MNEKFAEWLHGAAIGIGWARYNQWGNGWNFICAISFDATVTQWTEDLDAGDFEAIEAADQLKACQARGACWLGIGTTPAIAAFNAEQAAMNYYMQQVL